MKRQVRLLRLALVALAAALMVACGSPTDSPPFATAPVSPAPTPAAQLTPLASPTSLPGGPTGPSEGDVFRTRLTMSNGNYGLDVVLHDTTGLVTGIAARPPGKPSFEDAIDNLDGQPDELLYTWLGGACDTVTTISFERTGSRFRLRATTQTTGQACELIGLSRQLLIQLEEPLDAALVNLAGD